MVYEWKTGFNKVDANVAGKEFERLEQTVGLSARTVVDASRAQGTPLHDEFEWDNEIAGEEWRLHQARRMIANLVIKVEEAPTTPVVRAFVKVEDVTPEYKPFTFVMKSEDSKQALLARALRELQAYQRKYSDLQELAGVFSEIDKLAVVLREVS